MKSEIFRHIAGYAVGGTIFLLLIPFGIFELSKLDYIMGEAVLIHSHIVRMIVTPFFFITGVVFMAWSNVFLFKIGKGGPADGLGVAISPRTKKLVISGPYRFTRNPMVFGAFSLYIAVAVSLNSILCLACLLILFFLASFYLKASEEKRMLRDFGEDYLKYKKEVSFLIPWVQKK